MELGSGNGRDAIFLGAHVKHLVAVDGSETGIANCIASKKEKGIRNVDFIHSLINDVNLANHIEKKFSVAGASGPIYIYSRFFLHSINDQDEDQLVILIDQLLGSRKGGVFIEFRTTKDEQLSKYTERHYRRYIEPSELAKKFTDIGYVVDYFVEGTGFAKYKVDDAHVARFILKKS